MSDTQPRDDTMADVTSLLLLGVLTSLGDVGCHSAGPSDHWRRDDSALVCASCSVKFTVTERKHHCRNCGEVFCAKYAQGTTSLAKQAMARVGFLAA